MYDSFVTKLGRREITKREKKVLLFLFPLQFLNHCEWCVCVYKTWMTSLIRHGCRKIVAFTLLTYDLQKH